MKFCPTCASPLKPRQDDERHPRLVCSAEACGYTWYDNPLPVVAAIVEHGGAVILVRNKGWPDSWFGLVSGFLEKGESPEEGILREILEEVGLRGEVLGFIGAYPFVEMNQIILAYHVRAQGEIVAGEEIASVKTVPVDKLRPWPLGTGHAVRDWLAARNLMGPRLA